MVNDYFLIVKIDHGNRPWWGLSVDYLDKLNEWDGKYFLVLLVSANEGWVYSKDEIIYNTNNELWYYNQTRNRYQIRVNNMRDSNSFISHWQFFNKIGVETS
jgi:hypothetical protein